MTALVAPDAWQKTAGRLLRLGGGSQGNELTLLVDGDDAFEAMLRAIHSARVRVWLEVYIFTPDRIGTAFFDALVAAARRGVDVRLLVDAFGSPEMRDEKVAPLLEAGGKFAIFNPPTWLSRKLPLFMRDHRKILIVDDDVAFCGGMNVSLDYGSARHGNGTFRDMHLMVMGPACRDLGAVFGFGWAHATSERLPLFAAVPERHDGSHVQILGSDQFRRRRGIQKALHQAVSRAQRRIRLTTPYFVPPPPLMRALCRAARRGVDVAVLTAGVSDVPIAAAAARHLYGTLLRSGVAIYEMTAKTLHAKTASIDGIYAHVGSFNLDRWSFERNLEVCAMALDPGFSSALDDIFERDLALSERITIDRWQRRSAVDVVVGWFAWHVARL
ncbi:MAG: phospholipase D-like domain-containing protein [Deltaproteobacteria bacterium]|nr:phospholipase D-like domain-containing protein [Deltaproteobacteria bacterium]